MIVSVTWIDWPTKLRAKSGKPSVGSSRTVTTVASVEVRVTDSECVIAWVASHLRAWKSSSVIMTKTVSTSAG